MWEREEEEEEEVAACMVEARKRRIASSTWDSVTREVRVSFARDSEMRVICQVGELLAWGILYGGVGWGSDDVGRVKYWGSRILGARDLRLRVVGL